MDMEVLLLEQFVKRKKLKYYSVESGILLFNGDSFTFNGTRGGFDLTYNLEAPNGLILINGFNYFDRTGLTIDLYITEGFGKTNKIELNQGSQPLYSYNPKILISCENSVQFRFSQQNQREGSFSFIKLLPGTQG